MYLYYYLLLLFLRTFWYQNMIKDNTRQCSRLSVFVNLPYFVNSIWNQMFYFNHEEDKILYNTRLPILLRPLVELPATPITFWRGCVPLILIVCYIHYFQPRTSDIFKFGRKFRKSLWVRCSAAKKWLCANCFCRAKRHTPVYPNLENWAWSSSETWVKSLECYRSIIYSHSIIDFFYLFPFVIFSWILMSMLFNASLSAKFADVMKWNGNCGIWKRRLRRMEYQCWTLVKIRKLHSLVKWLTLK